MAVQFPQPLVVGFNPGTDVSAGGPVWQLPAGYVYVDPTATLFPSSVPPAILPWVLAVPGYFVRTTPGVYNKIPDIGSDPGTRFIMNDLAGAGLSLDDIYTAAMQAVIDDPVQDPFDWSHGYRVMLVEVAKTQPDIAQALALTQAQIDSAAAWGAAIGKQAAEFDRSRFDSFMAQWGWVLPIAGFVGTALVAGAGATTAVAGAEAAGTTAAAPAAAAGGGAAATGATVAVGGAGAAAGAAGGGITAGTAVTAGGAVASVASTVSSGTQAATDAATAANAASVGSVVSGIGDWLSQAKQFVSDIITPVKGLVDQVTSIVRDVNDNLIAPITNTIQTTIKTYQTLVTNLHDDLKAGLSGILKIPGQISDAFTSVDASLSRAMQQLGLTNADTVGKVLIPGMRDTLGVHLANLSAMVGRPENLQSSAAAVKVTDSLKEGMNVGDVETTINAFLKSAENPTTWYEYVLNWVVNFVQVNIYLAQKLENAVEPYADAVRANNPYTKLDPSVVLEAARRGIMSPDDAGNEMLRLGYNVDRQRIMFDAARFLFTIRDAVTLYQRGEIDRPTFLLLASQNGLDEGQADFAVALQAFLFTPQDASSLLARGVISQQTFIALCAANGLDSTQADSVRSLVSTLVNPLAQIAYAQKTGPVANGFLAETFSIPIPQDVADQYDRNQVETSQAVIDWFLHWQVPEPDWWVQAYFRGLRTRSECYAAFQFWGIPKETWDDQFTVRGEIMSAFILVEVLKAGVLNEDEARTIMRQRGLVPEDIDILIKYANAGGKTSKAQTAGDLQKVSLGNAAALYDDKAIDRPTYLAILQQHGYSADAAELTAELADIKAAQAQRNDFASSLVSQVQLGILSRDDALSQLYAAGFADAEVIKYAAKIDAAKVANVKLPSRAELDAMLKKGAIDQATWQATMLQLGYSQQWVDALYKIV